MTQAVTPSLRQPFFLPATPGRRLCIYHPPATTVCRANVLHIHAFGEEMNKARRMVALQARAFAELGLGVLLIDLYGCGDSSGDFADARWEIWRDDIAQAVDWLKQREEVPIVLWGLRLGASLMMDYAKASGEAFESFVLWQPVVNGEAYLTQFLRLRVASEMMAEGRAKVGTRELKDILKSGDSLEIAGYEVSSELAVALDGLRLADLVVPGSTCHWLEVTGDESGLVSPASRRVIDDWTAAGVKPRPRVVTGEPFWTTQEITECRPLIAATTQLFSQGLE